MHHQSQSGTDLIRQLTHCLRSERTLTANIRTVTAKLTGEPVQPIIARDFVEAWPLGAALITDRHRDVIAANTAAAELWGTQNGLITSFENPDQFPDWATHAPAVVERLRADADLWPDDRYRELIGDLMGYDDFRELWRSPQPAVTVPTAGTLTYTHAGRPYEAVHLPISPTHPDELRIVLSVPLSPAECGLAN